MDEDDDFVRSSPQKAFFSSEVRSKATPKPIDLGVLALLLAVQWNLAAFGHI